MRRIARHGHHGHLGVAELPRLIRVSPERCWKTTTELGLAVCGMEQMASRGVGGHLPGPDRPAAAALFADPPLAAQAPAKRARGFKAVSFPSCGAVRLAPVTPGCGYFPRGVPKTQDGRLPAHRSAGGGPAPDTPSRRSRRCPVNALVACADWLWSGVQVRVPAPEHHARQGRLGWVAMLGRPRPTVSSRPTRVRAEAAPGRRPAAQRGAAAQVLVLLFDHPDRVRHSRRDRDRPRSFERLRRLDVADTKAVVATSQVCGLDAARITRATPRVAPPPAADKVAESAMLNS